MRKLRADKRSFSFTWMRGQNGHKPTGEGTVVGFENPAATVDATESGQIEARPANAQWYNTSSSSSSGISSMSDSSSITSVSSSIPGNANNDAAAEKEISSSGLSRSDNSKGRLRRLGSSFTRFGTKYSIIEDDDETNMEEDVVTDVKPTPATTASVMPSLATPMTALNISTKESLEPTILSEIQKEPVHFDEDGNFVGRLGRPFSSRRKSSSSGKEAGNASSFGRKINKTVQDVKASIGSFSQRFRRSTRRRYRMGVGSPLTELTPTRRILGRTPTKLYSPFGIGLDSPAFKTPKRLDRPSPTPRLTRRSIISGIAYSPANNFGKDLADARRGMEDFHMLTRDITRRSVRF